MGHTVPLKLPVFSDIYLRLFVYKTAYTGVVKGVKMERMESVDGPAVRISFYDLVSHFTV